MDGVMRREENRNEGSDIGISVGYQRRHWSVAQRAAIVAESLVDGAKVSEIAARHDLNPSVLFAWRRRAMAAQKEIASPGTAERVDVEAAPFVPVSIREVKTDAGTSAPPMRTGMIEITVADASIRVMPGVDAATLATVLAALRGAC